MLATKRVVPEKKYIPYSYEDNLLGIMVETRTEERGIVSYQNKYGVRIGEHLIHYNNLLSGFTYLDGSPCGKEELGV